MRITSAHRGEISHYFTGQRLITRREEGRQGEEKIRQRMGLAPEKRRLESTRQANRDEPPFECQSRGFGIEKLGRNGSLPCICRRQPYLRADLPSQKGVRSPCRLPVPGLVGEKPPTQDGEGNTEADCREGETECGRDIGTPVATPMTRRCLGDLAPYKDAPPLTLPRRASTQGQRHG